MDYKDFEYLKGLVRQIRAGFEPLTAKVESDVLTLSGDREDLDGRYRVSGTERLRIIRLEEKVTEVVLKEAPTPKQLTAPCTKCGNEFTRSKFNPYLTDCPECRRKDRKTGGEGRKFTCQKCGDEFTISKYQPYLEPTKCQRCTRNEGIRRRQRGREERRKATD
jgi:predicted Zn-ribbon and HTH transcriptional regulator